MKLSENFKTEQPQVLVSKNASVPQIVHAVCRNFKANTADKNTGRQGGEDLQTTTGLGMMHSTVPWMRERRQHQVEVQIVSKRSARVRDSCNCGRRGFGSQMAQAVDRDLIGATERMKDAFKADPLAGRNQGRQGGVFAAVSRPHGFNFHMTTPRLKLSLSLCFGKSCIQLEGGGCFGRQSLGDLYHMCEIF